MGAPSAQVQSSQSSDPASKGAGTSPSTPSGNGKGASMSATSGQPQMGQPNTYGNTGLAPVDVSGFTTISDTSKVASNTGPVNGPVPLGQSITMAELQNQTKAANDRRTFDPAPMQTAPKAYSNFVAPTDGSTNNNPYPNTINNMGAVAGGPNGQPIGKGAGGSNSGTGKSSTNP